MHENVPLHVPNPLYPITQFIFGVFDYSFALRRNVDCRLSHLFVLFCGPVVVGTA